MRVLTKSRFKLALECPNKLYYTRKKEYVNNKNDNPFLAALADGGFQVEELARMQYPGGVLVDDDKYDRYDYQALWEETQELLKRDKVIIYEAAFLIDGLFIRTDILVKNGDYIKLIEVKSKTFDPTDDHLLVGVRGKIVSTWKPYLMDVAFQQHVMSLCYPSWRIDSYLMLADKTKTATIDGLNQNFRIKANSNNRTGITIVDRNIENLGVSVLGLKNITDIVQKIHEGEWAAIDTLSFHELLKLAQEEYIGDTYASWPVSYRACKNCEFKATEEQRSEGIKSGYHNCFQKQRGWTDEQFNKQNTFDIWDFKCGQKLFSQDLIFKEQLTPDDINHKESDNLISRTDRQWIQIIRSREQDNTPYILKEQLAEQIDSWSYPLNFIDFETNTVALPFHRGRHPYENIAFQYSHHIYHENGKVEHAGQYINNTAGEFPNFEFMRHLKKSLETNEGSIFRYSAHENTVLNTLYYQLSASNEPDRQELMEFILHITHSRKNATQQWSGERDMIDQLEMVKKYYYNPLTNGSNSLKYVLPAILQSDQIIQAKYAQAIGDISVSSLNFQNNHIWLKTQDDKVVNPYKMLPPVFPNWSEDDIADAVSNMEELGDGGAAMIAYAKMQYTNMTDRERTLLTDALLRYCELDTLAMVMLHEHFMNVVA